MKTPVIEVEGFECRGCGGNIVERAAHNVVVRCAKCGSEEIDDVLIETALPWVWEICGGCNGNGKHDHPAFGNGITADEWNGPDWDDDSRQTYRSGGYDVSCGECDGTGKVMVVDEDACDPDLLDAYRDDREAAAECDAESRMERMMGA